LNQRDANHINATCMLYGLRLNFFRKLRLAGSVKGLARNMRRAAMRSTLDFLTLFAQQVAEHADLAELRNRGFDDFESLEETDRARFNSYMHALFRIVEDVYYQHLEGI